MSNIVIMNHNALITAYHAIIRAVFVLCSLSPPRSFNGSSPNLVAVCRVDLRIALEGFFFEKVNGSLSLSTILYMRQAHATHLQKVPFTLLLLHLRV